MSYIYIYMELLVKPEMLTSNIYGPTFGNAETVSFYLLHNVSTAGKVFTHKCDTGNLSALIQCCNIMQQIERDCFSVVKHRSIYI